MGAVYDSLLGKLLLHKHKITDIIGTFTGSSIGTERFVSTEGQTIFTISNFIPNSAIIVSRQGAIEDINLRTISGQNAILTVPGFEGEVIIFKQ